MPHKLKRTLHIGLGGTGVKALLQAKQCYLDAYGEIPPMVAFLAIDTDNASRSASRMTRNGKTVQLEDHEIALCGLTGDARDIYKHYPQDYAWIPKNNVRHLSGLKTEGAGQIRSNGRFLIQYNATNILTKIQQVINHVAQPIPQDAEFTYDYDQDGTQMPTYVNVVASIAGGTGAGTLIDLLVLLADKLHNTNPPTRIRPWIVMPDIFRHNFPHVLSEKVYSNAYGVLRELDYIYHMDGVDNNQPLSFRFCKIDHKPSELGDSILMNMTNSVGVKYQTVEDVTETLGRCLYIDSNEYSGAIASAFDNTQHSEGHNIKDKVAHYFSTGSADLIYDNNAVANVIADAIISRICDNLRSVDNFTASTEALNWTMDPNVRIQEHDMDQLTDDLLTRIPPYLFEIGKDTTVNEINAFINSVINEDVRNKVQETWQTKLNNVKSQLDEKVKSLLNNHGSGKALAFLEALKKNVVACKDEMNTELSGLSENNALERNWDAKLSGLKNSIFGFTKFDSETAESVANEVVEDAADRRDALRHAWAISFYENLIESIGDHKREVSLLDTQLKNICNDRITLIGTIRTRSLEKSNFQIFLHQTDVMKEPDFDIFAIMQQLQSQIKISDLIGKREDYISAELWEFAKKLNEPLSARNVSIEDKLKNMPKEKILELVESLKRMSSPMWSTNTQGYENINRRLVTNFVIGTANGALSALNNDKYVELLTIDSNKPSFVKTNLNDRVSLIQVQSSNPVFAIANMAEYKREAEIIDKDNNKSSYFIDNDWNDRMKRENFSVYPKGDGEDVLPAWVNGIVYGYIKFDEERNEYYMESEQGDPLEGGYLSLGKRRDIAFNAFKEKELSKEIQDNIANLIKQKGSDAVTEVLRTVRNDLKNYVTKYASLSNIELNAIKLKDEAYNMVRSVLEKEVGYLRSIEK